jgi:hypothetical protein
MNTRRLIMLGGVLLAGALIAASLLVFQWIRRDEIDAPERGASPSEGLIVTSPIQGETVMSPLEVSGKARGGWFFEASFPVRLEEASGRVLAEVPAQAQGEWMTEGYVPFVAELAFEVAVLTPGRVVLRKDNPSGLPEHDEERSVAVTLSPSPTVQVFFMNNRLDPEITCEKVWPVKRAIQPGADQKLAALAALLAGPTIDETADEYSTVINSGVVVNKIEVGPDGIARVDFSARLNEAVAGSCRVGSIRAQITATLRQFPDVRGVVISVNGRADDILQP